MAIKLSKRFAGNIPDAALKTVLCEVVNALCLAAKDISDLCAQGPLLDGLGETTGVENADGDNQKALDIQSDEIIINLLKKVPVAYYASEEEEGINTLNPDAPISVAADPLDGSSNIDTNVSIGTIFSIFQTVPGAPEKSFFRCGEEQLVGGFFVYGPQTTLIITAGDGVELYVLEPKQNRFVLAIPEIRLARSACEYGINASNSRHWYRPIRNFIEDCASGKKGPLGSDYNMRWVGSLVADASRILSRGGLFLYPADGRKNYQQGRLRQLYEANPVAFIIEQAGGSATDGSKRILDQSLSELHQRIPFVFGSKKQVALVKSYHDRPGFLGSRAPLFNPRGLFRK
ncbi:Fructose-1,6-bisphosphatase, type I [hydrothermal vent metagenome]|uniref:fructose-bisphosphatase n=1 Tax=hydrothermal vent metagenome TaxID=652676 RepID=A0A3B0SFA6_9ZZZZ